MKKADESSLTGAATFRLRIQFSEQHRAFLMAALYLSLILMALARRWTGGVVMSNPRGFFWTHAQIGAS